MPDAVMIFAAGLGTRMGALTHDRPKPMIEVAGRPLIDHALEHVSRRPGLRAVANVHYKPDRLIAHLKARGVAISDERGALLETGGGLRKALPLLGAEPVFTMNSDAILSGPNPLDCLAEAWDPVRMDALLLCVTLARAEGRAAPGDFTQGPDGALRRGGDLVYTGVQILRTAGLADIGEEAFSLNLLWDRMIARGRLFGCAYPGRWCDVGRPDGIATAEALLAETRDV
ncbi:nucleotidyltransferase family protein [Poseidonocella sedimentorum]|uniref:MobA-like NTP transferase domain-containing protein n=1 Tax=Poseidonocella sedimentorum TaxID=871652 RepID=A0A1I6D6V7_9RHOB|nr:nucleotidyltransferase family protein [Poseidonocella sedimentorum]SFR01199.1 MobA-like NTP transferase domain-containing protein [Poseidonocella sedimentorum]